MKFRLKCKLRPTVAAPFERCGKSPTGAWSAGKGRRSTTCLPQGKGQARILGGNAVKLFNIDINGKKLAEVA
jgi:hypothetical protein